MKLVLASQSPRRAELLRNAGYEFTVRPANVDESVLENEDPRKHVERLAMQKAQATPAEPGEIIIGADTVVVIDKEILGKPKDPDDAARMLRLLSGRRHEVLTGICFRCGALIVKDWAATRVWFCELSKADIADYVATGEPMDKAGAYAIQGRASRFIERIDGSYTNVVGLPVALLHSHLRRVDCE